MADVPSKTHQAKVQDVLRVKEDISVLLSNVRTQMALADKYSNENQYLQDYIASVMKSGDLK